MKVGTARQKKHFFEFGPFRVDTVKRRLLREGHPVPLTPKAFDTLIVLLQHSGQVLEKDELIEAVWPETAVEENNLTQNIYALRKALGDSANESRYILTIPGMGYRFVPEVTEVTADDTELVARERSRTHIVIEEQETDEKDEAEQAPQQTALTAKADSPGMGTVKLAAVARRLVGEKRAAALAMLVVAAAVIVFVVFKPQRYISEDEAREKTVAGFVKFDITKLTAYIDARRAAISPDGKYVVFTAHDAGRESLWLRQVAVANSQQIIPPAKARYFGLAFSPDGNYVYYIRSEEDEPLRVLYRMPALGGVSKRLLSDLEDSITFSPDGNRIAFTRSSQGEDESVLMTASADGTQEQKLAAHNLANRFGSPSWSPDGKLIVCAVGTAHTGSNEMGLIEVDAESGTEKTITSQKWEYIRIAIWLTDGSGLLMIAREQGSTASRIWHLSYPGAEARSITDNSDYYNELSLATDSMTVAAVQSIGTANIWIVPQGDASRAYQTVHAFGGLSWTADGRIVYASFAGGNWDIWIMDADGSSQKQLTADAGKNASPAVSPDGRYIVFVSDRSGAFHIWRMNIDGGNPIQLTNGSGENVPTVSPDGRWVVYTSVSDWTLWKVPTDLGEPVKLTNGNSRWPAVSPDGKWIAYFRVEGSPYPRCRVAVIPFEGGEPVKIFHSSPRVPTSLDVRWIGGRALAYAIDRNEVSNIWVQSLDGGLPKQMTHFASEEILCFAWSPDGKQLACVRGSSTSDVVLIRNLGNPELF
jgi:Tol biopolymer transport system component/DNA-binding winged helix-turn-helix (wHTH) protein